MGTLRLRLAGWSLPGPSTLALPKPMSSPAPNAGHPRLREARRAFPTGRMSPREESGSSGSHSSLVVGQGLTFLDLHSAPSPSKERCQATEHITSHHLHCYHLVLATICLSRWSQWCPGKSPGSCRGMIVVPGVVSTQLSLSCQLPMPKSWGVEGVPPPCSGAPPVIVIATPTPATVDQREKHLFSPEKAQK